MSNYTVKVKFSTARAGRGKGTVIGDSGYGDVDITADGELYTKDKDDPELIEGCKAAIQDNPKIKGTVLSLEILEIIEKP